MTKFDVLDVKILKNMSFQQPKCTIWSTWTIWNCSIESSRCLQKLSPTVSFSIPTRWQKISIPREETRETRSIYARWSDIRVEIHLQRDPWGREVPDATSIAEGNSILEWICEEDEIGEDGDELELTVSEKCENWSISTVFCLKNSRNHQISNDFDGFLEFSIKIWVFNLNICYNSSNFTNFNWFFTNFHSKLPKNPFFSFDNAGISALHARIYLIFRKIRLKIGRFQLVFRRKIIEITNLK